MRHKNTALRRERAELPTPHHLCAREGRRENEGGGGGGEREREKARGREGRREGGEKTITLASIYM